MRAARRKPFLFCQIFLLLLINACTIAFSSAGYDEDPPVRASTPEINYHDIRSHVRYLSSLNSRVTGMSCPGYRNATEYIMDEFQKLGLKVRTQSYSLAIPVDKGSWIYVDKLAENFTAHAVWPNGVAAPRINGLRGDLKYVGDGAIDRLNGLNLTDAILLMDFNSGQNWLTAAKLGAKAVIFVEPLTTNKYESLLKTVSVPLYFPRLYVDRNVGTILKELCQKNEEVSVTTHSDFQWKEDTAYNIMGVLEGGQPNDVIAIVTHYDSWSVVPTIAPGAEDAIGVSVLLELAEYFSEQDSKPERTIWFVACSGHWQGLLGPTWWEEEIVLNSEERIWLQMGLDLSSDSHGLDLLYLDPLTGSGQESQIYTRNTSPFVASQFSVRYSWVESAFSRYLDDFPLDAIMEIAGNEDIDAKDLVKSSFIGDGWWGTQPDFYFLDTEPALTTGALAFTFRTQYSRKLGWFSPLNDCDQIDWMNVNTQTLTLAYLLENLISERNWELDYGSVAPTRQVRTLGGGAVGDVTVKGKTVTFSYEDGWYVPLEKTLVRLFLHNPGEYLYWPFASRHSFSDDKGDFAFSLLTPWMTWAFDAWKFNDAGNVRYTIDRGFYGTAQGASGGISTSAYPMTEEYEILLSLFECTSITVFDLSDYNLITRTLVVDQRNSGGGTGGFALKSNFFAEGSNIEMYDYHPRSEPVFFDSHFSFEGVGITFVRPYSTIALTFTAGRSRMVLINSTEDQPEGNGYFVDKPIVIHRTAYQAAENMLTTIRERYEVLKMFDVRSKTAEKMLEKCEYYLGEASSYYNNFTYDRGYENSLVALAFADKVYSSTVMPLYNDTSLSMLFFSLLILPASILFERLFFTAGGLRRMVRPLLIVVFFFIVFYFVHPAFKLMNNLFMAIIGLGTMLLSLFVLLIFLKNAMRSLEEKTASKLGFHVLKKGGSSVATHLLAASTEYLKRRLLFTLLIFLAVVIYTAAQTSFTSTSYGYQIFASSVSLKTPYTGLMIKKSWGFPAAEATGGVLDELLIPYLKGVAGDRFHVAPRVWLYGTSSYPEGVHSNVMSSPQGETRTFHLSPSVFLGLTSEELLEILPGSLIVLAGSFADEEIPKCVISEFIANQIDVEIGSRIHVDGLGVDLKVVGIIDPNIRFDPESGKADFDGKSYIPIDPQFSSALALLPQFQLPTSIQPYPIPPDNLVIIPWETALRFGGFISSIALIPSENVTKEDMNRIAEDISLSTQLSVAVGGEGEVISFRKLFTFEVFGWEMILIPLVIISFSTVNFLLGDVKRKERDIFVYASLGLSPRGVGLFFFTEMLVYAVCGTLVGYLVGLGMNKLLIAFRILPESFVFNFVSGFIVISLGVIILIMVVSTLYPVIMASKLITPSLERKWKLRTRPKGDTWQIPLPFRIPEKKEAIGLLSYIAEYYSDLGYIKVNFKLDSSPILNPREMEVTMDVTLNPPELGLTQKANLSAVESMEGDYTFFLTIHRESGDAKMWSVRNYYYIDDVRKQFLLWRALTPERKEEYMSQDTSVTD